MTKSSILISPNITPYIVQDKRYLIKWWHGHLL